MTTDEIIFRKAAEDRINRNKNNSENDQNYLNTPNKTTPTKHRKIRRESILSFIDKSNNKELNTTPNIARLATIDYKINGTRALAFDNEFIRPRWVPDEEINNCYNCHDEFNFINRKHHCRHCGNIFCNICSSLSCLLPEKFGHGSDPKRVCKKCYDLLDNSQNELSLSIGNHQKDNYVDLSYSDTCIPTRYLNLPITFNLDNDIRKATYTIYNILEQGLIKDNQSIINLIKKCKGLVFLTVIKGGFIFAPKIGTGLVISKFKNNYWSPPSAIGTIGISYGAIIGAEITDYLIFLNDDDALNSFTSDKQLSFGAGIDIAIGNIGRSGMIDINISDKGSCTLFSYSQSRGFLAGASLDGSIISTRNDINHKFYGRKLTPKELLSGILNDGTYINPLPKAAQPLYDALNKILYINL